MPYLCNILGQRIKMGGRRSLERERPLICLCGEIVTVESNCSDPALRCTDRSHTRQCPHEHAAIIQCWSREARCLIYSHCTNHLTTLAVESVEGAARVKAINGVAAHDRRAGHLPWCMPAHCQLIAGTNQHLSH